MQDLTWYTNGRRMISPRSKGWHKGAKDARQALGGTCIASRTTRLQEVRQSWPQKTFDSSLDA